MEGGNGTGVVPVAWWQRKPLDEVDDELHLGRVASVQIHPDHRIVVGDGDEGVVGRNWGSEVTAEKAGWACGVLTGLLDVAANTATSVRSRMSRSLSSRPLLDRCKGK